ncbi:MAG: aminotransferase class V-fold PLP-dependent enzyme [Bacteroidales bacterium]|nr:aminotransferase class V-fold PLP-dependent enzyme [Bacteroidales bacterium]MCF8350770.1 aminotransferase class V-fold PLP-dependent enzyme [Bacteroidales bacterium]MCF8376863.1 aminotransferase class V-fold PLP-dependent enzyme [Bacteroidales bacterium]MCF8401878.1 aminotransferase class V-fold PLP-dependent enzyme [Bacteroidales bacterium]
MSKLENYFGKFRENTIGHDVEFKTPYGFKKMLYADWIASGRLYGPIEDKMLNLFGPYIGNTHTETSETGTLMTKSYHYAQQIIKDHVNAGPADVIITTGFGMTSAVVKFQRILGLKTCGKLLNKKCLDKSERPVVFVTHMEHHSNHTSWYETVADVVQLQPDQDMLVDLDDLKKQLNKYKDRQLKLGAFTACSNVTGIETPYHKMAKIMHQHGGLAFIDYAASAPYVDINMHPEDPLEKLDAIYFSPHKFLGGPGSSGVLIFDSKLYRNHSPDQPGGGTVDWTNPWGEYKFIDQIEAREDGGTPGFLQAIRTALSIKLKIQMTTAKIREREEELVEKAFKKLSGIPDLNILADNIKQRLGIISLYIEGIHFNLVVKLLNDRFGIQVRGGCACAGTYGHYLLNVSYEDSHNITSLINSGDLSKKPGWIRLSLHPTMTDKELDYVIDALMQIRKNHIEWGKDYVYNRKANEFRHKTEPMDKTEWVKPWFELED